MVAAYDLLRQDERIIRRQGSGTRVAGPEPGGVRRTTSAPIFLHLLEPGDGVSPLACAAPDTSPPELAEAYARIVPTLVAPGDIGYYPAGHPALRRAIADRYTGRGIRTGPEHILVTADAQRLSRRSPARCWHRATGYWSRDPPTPARWRRSGSTQPCRVRCRSGSATWPQRASSTPSSPR